MSLIKRLTRRVARPLLDRLDRRSRTVTAQYLTPSLLVERIEPFVRAEIEPFVRAEIERAGRLSDEDRHREEVRRDREYSYSLVLASGLSSLDRTVTPGMIRGLKGQINRLTPSPLIGTLMTQAYRAILDHETRGVGRIAGSTYNILGKLVVPPLLEPPAGPVLEIGTLYGLFIPALIRQLRHSGEVRELTVVDPFLGIQLQPGTSMAAADASGVPVTAEIALANMFTCGLSPDAVRLVQGLSTDQEAQHQAGDRRYAVVVIDGDHSEAGVLADLWWVETICLPGAVVVMDDYGDRKWIGVQAAVERYLAGGGRLELLGAASTSAYLRMPTD